MSASIEEGAAELNRAQFSVEKFVESFPILAGARKGGEALRQLVIDAAIHGRLAPQISSEGNGVEVIQRAVENGCLAARGGEPRTGAPPVNDKPVVPFPLPRSWAWCRLEHLATKLGAGSTPLGGRAVYKMSGVSFLRSQNVWNNGLRLDDVAFIDRVTHERMSGTHVLPGDLLLNITGASIGRCALVEDHFREANVSQHVAIVRPAWAPTRAFLHLCARSTYFQSMIMDVQVGVSREGLSMKRLTEFPIPVPPLAEQQRIIAKVDELMRLLDDLEAKQARKQQVQARFRSAAMGGLASAGDAGNLATAWERLASDFAVCLGTSESVAALRRTILDLGTMGCITSPAMHNASTDMASGSLVGLPPRWRWTECSMLCDPKRIITYGVIKLGPEITGGVPTLRSSNVRWLRVDETGIKRIAPGLADSFRRTTLRGGEVVITVRGTLGGVAVVPKHLKGANVSREVAVLPFDSSYSPEFLAMCVASPRSQNWLTHVTKGIAYEGINIGDLRKLPIPLPPLDEQRQIVAKVNQLMKLCDDLESKLSRQEEIAANLVEAVVARLAA